MASRVDATFDFFACSGAVANNILFSGEGQFGEPPQASGGQVDQTRDLITLTIGGNDVYFARILAYCLAHNHCNDLKPFDPHIDLELGDLFPLWVAVVRERLVAVYGELKALAPNATIIALDYPLVVSGNECSASHLPFVPDARLSAEEQTWMREANRVLNRAIRDAAAQVGVHYVSVQDHFEGHEVCGDSDDWIFGTLHFWLRGWFHPTARLEFCTF